MASELKLNSKKLAVAAFFALLAPIWVFFAAPNLTKLPSNFQFSADIISVDNFFNEETQEYAGDFYSKTEYSYHTVSSTPNISFIKNKFEVRSFEDELIVSIERDYSVDREKREHIQVSGYTPRNGYLFAPKNLKTGQPFTYWHVNYDGPAHMEFVAEEKIHGLQTFHYQTFYEGVDIDQTDNLDFLPLVGEERGIILRPHLQIWVEPETGRLVKYEDNTVAYYYDLDSGEILHPWNHFQNSFNASSVLDIVEDIKLEKSKARLFNLYIPVFFTIVALLLLLSEISKFQRVRALVRTKVLTILVGFFTLAVSLLSLLGWVIDSQALTRIIPHASAMNPLTAVCFALLGLALVLHTNYKGWVTVAIGLLVSTIGLARIFETLGLSNFAIDLIIFGEAVQSYPVLARMAQYTAVSFFLMGLVPLFGKMEFFTKFRLAEIFSSLVYLFALLALFSFLFDSLSIVRLPVFFSAAVHTALLFFILGSTSYFAYRRRSNYNIGFGGWFSVSYVLFSLLVLTLIFSNLVDIAFTNDSKNDFSRSVDVAAKNIEDRMSVYISVLRGAHGLLEASEVVERHEWKNYTDALELSKNYPGIQGVGYAIFVKPEELEEHEKSIREEGFPDYFVKPAGERDLYSTIIYLEPFDERNREAFGFDMFQEPTRRKGMELARDSGEPRVSGRITLVQEIDEDVQPGFLVYVPYYKKGTTTDDLESRRENIVGYVYAAFRARNFVESVIGDTGLDNISLRINDGTSKNVASTIYDDSHKIDDIDSSRFIETKTLFIAGRPWTLTFHSSSDYGQTRYSQLASVFIIVIGIFVSMITSLMFYTLISSRSKALAFADEATSELKLAKNKIEEKLSESDRLNKLMVDREIKMVEMKKKLNDSNNN